MDELLADFLAETRIELDRIEDALARLEQGDEVSENTQALKRGMDMIRARSGLLGFSRIASLAEAADAHLQPVYATGVIAEADVAGLRRAVDRIARLTSALAATGSEAQDGETATDDAAERLARLASAFPQAPGAAASWAPIEAIAASVCAELGKPVLIEIEASARALPDLVVRPLVGALQRFVRYSCIYGIEPDLVRRARGKRVPGSVRISAMRLDGEAVIAVADDGAGLNLDRLRRRASALKLVANNAAADMKDAQAAQLVFEPGVSIFGENDNDGGLDRAKAIVDRVGGGVDVSTLEGRGVTFLLRVPVTPPAPALGGAKR
jgi:chemotaxis protein histidine kinase CheA